MDRIVALGLDGGPRVGDAAAPVASAQPALALVVGERTYLVDAGLDTARQLVRAGLTFASVRDVFITHQHFDHTSGIPGLVLHGWTAAPPNTGLRVWGPPSTAAQIDRIRSAFTTEIGLFEAGGGFGPFPALEAHDLDVSTGPAITRVMDDDLVTVDAVHVFHGPEVPDAYAYRFTIRRSGRVIIFSGDTAAPDANLIALAAGCDVLVHEAQDNDNVERIASRVPDPARAEQLRAHLFAAHSDIADVVGVAATAGAKRVVFCHYTPLPQAPAIYREKALAAAQRIGYAGEIIAPAELDVIELETDPMS